MFAHPNRQVFVQTLQAYRRGCQHNMPGTFTDGNRSLCQVAQACTPMCGCVWHCGNSRGLFMQPQQLATAPATPHPTTHNNPPPVPHPLHQHSKAAAKNNAATVVPAKAWQWPWLHAPVEKKVIWQQQWLHPKAAAAAAQLGRGGAASNNTATVAHSGSSGADCTGPHR